MKIRRNKRIVYPTHSFSYLDLFQSGRALKPGWKGGKLGGEEGMAPPRFIVLSATYNQQMSYTVKKEVC